MGYLIGGHVITCTYVTLILSLLLLHLLVHNPNTFFHIPFQGPIPISLVFALALKLLQ